LGFRRQKCYEIDFSKIDEGYLSCETFCQAETVGKAKSLLMEQIRHDSWKLKYSNEDVAYLNIPVKRSKENDIYDFEGVNMVMSIIRIKLRERQRVDELNTVLNDESIKYCYIKKRGLYYLPTSSGYTERITQAGVFEKVCAVGSAKSCDEIIIVPINIFDHNQRIANEVKELNSRILII